MLKVLLSAYNYNVTCPLLLYMEITPRLVISCTTGVVSSSPIRSRRPSTALGEAATSAMSHLSSVP